ncbi:aryl-sulfate sulfotransferase [Amycolatopsis alkalitolerans]|uniref:Aryl sulfotransferase n=1 Tax=Amycolatopsis alkalitolerans TaxID=2547244 RepID=A0A5C4LVG6_9PSEU|nr:aryl-sulfate sulfotransferase [Amycolatopsis alkalitolerans]TNC22907.1 aryl sulfotransferase [Amycolatopsis alkalitolerans]
MDQNTLRRRGTGLIGVDRDLSFGGYTLYAPLTSPGVVHLVDLDGNEVHRWRLPYRPGRHACILPNGNLAYNGALPGVPAPFDMWHKYRGGVMCEVDPHGTVLREHRDPWAHHDANHLGDGRILYTSVEPVDPGEVCGGVAGTEAGGKVYADVVKEVDAEGNLLWSWHAIEHLRPEDYPLQPHYWREHWPLINSVAELSDGNVVASLRSVSAVIVIERTSGKVVWRLGSDFLAQQHCVSELDNGHLLIFDNGTFRPRESITYSRIVEVDRATSEIAWEYTDSTREAFFTPFMGSAQRLANGNTLVTESAFGRIFEITAAGEVCWEFVVPQFAKYGEPEAAQVFPVESNALFRAYRYAPEELPWLS